MVIKLRFTGNGRPLFLDRQKLRLKGHKSIKPYIKTVQNRRISLRAIRTPRGGGFFWDSRSVLNIFVGKDYTNVYYSPNDSVIRLESHIDLQKEVEAFYDTYSRLDFKSQDSIWFKNNQYEAEIFVKPIDDSLYHFNEVIEHVALGFQGY